MTERMYFVRRCLRLELQIETLQQRLLEQRPNRRCVTDADRAHMCALRQQGTSVRAIARATGWSFGTVYNAINAPPL